ADQAKEAEINDYAWSPDSRYLAYSKQHPDQMRQIYLFPIETGKVTRLTSEMNDSRSPVFDPGGRYLYFLSDRDLLASVGAFDFSYVYDNVTRVYALTLRKDLPSPFAPESDEARVDGAGGEAGSAAEPAKEKDAGKEKKTGGKAAAKEVAPIRIDLEGIEDRIVAFPI